jgi:hypothetical protein
MQICRWLCRGTMPVPSPEKLWDGATVLYLLAVLRNENKSAKIGAETVLMTLELEVCRRSQISGAPRSRKKV